MKIIELINEQTIGTVGSSTAPQPMSPSTPPPPQKPTTQPKQDPNREQLAKLLLPHGIKSDQLDKASSALQTVFTMPNNLTPDQKTLIGPLVNPLLKNQSFAMALKNLAMQKPQSTTATNQTTMSKPV